MWWLNVIPVSHGRARVEIGGCFPQDLLSLPDFRERARAYEQRWETVLREDIDILERQQIALSSALFRPGPLSGRDDMVQAVSRWSVLRRYGPRSAFCWACWLLAESPSCATFT